MHYKREYLNLIFTNHAMERMGDRGMKQEWAWETWRHPDTTTDGNTEGSIRYEKQFDTYHVTVVAKQNERKEWIIISAWVDPPMPGSIDQGNKERYHRFQKASFLGKLWMTLKQQVGL